MSDERVPDARLAQPLAAEARDASGPLPTSTAIARSWSRPATPGGQPPGSLPRRRRYLLLSIASCVSRSMSASICATDWSPLYVASSSFPAKSSTRWKPFTNCQGRAYGASRRKFALPAGAVTSLRDGQVARVLRPRPLPVLPQRGSGAAARRPSCSTSPCRSSTRREPEVAAGLAADHRVHGEPNAREVRLQVAVDPVALEDDRRLLLADRLTAPADPELRRRLARPLRSQPR